MNQRWYIGKLVDSYIASLCSDLKNGILPKWEYLMYLYREEFIKLDSNYGWMLTSKGVQVVITYGYWNSGDGMWKI